MPGIGQSPTSEPGKAHTVTRDDQAELNALNAIVDRMRAFTATDPYFLTIPQDVEPRYHHTYQLAATQWLHQTPFQWKEGEMMQYQTYIFHEPGRDMYLQHPTRLREDDDATNGKGKPTTKPMTTVGTPNVNGGAKKKISLDTYKKKQAGASTPAKQEEEKKSVKGEIPSPVKPLAIKGPAERVKAETDELLAAAAEVSIDDVLGVTELKTSVKRKRDAEAKDSQDTIDACSQPSEDPVKKRQRVSASETVSVAPSEVAPVKKEAQDAQGLHPAREVQRKSATPPSAQMDSEMGLPPRLSPLDLPTLPSRLSPTIPANIAATLKAREELRKSASEKALTPAKHGMLTPNRAVDGVAKRKSPVPRNGFRATSSSPAVRSDVEEPSRAAAMLAPPPRFQTPDLSQGEEIAIGKALKAKRAAKPSLVVKLKIKKHQREAVRRILKMRPNPSKTNTSETDLLPTESTRVEKQAADVTKKRDANTRGVAQKVGPITPVVNGAINKQEAKDAIFDRASQSSQHAAKADETTATISTTTTTKNESGPAAVTSNDTLAKRKKAPSSVDVQKQPSTPTQPDLPSPTLLSSAQKSHQATPGLRKDHLSAVAMAREQSMQSNPDTPSAKSSTPLPDGSAQTNGVFPTRPSSAQPNHKSAQYVAWENEDIRLEALGRELKHAASADLQSSDDSTETTKKLAAVKSLESLLAYFLAFVAHDEALLAADPKQSPVAWKWKTLHPFLRFVKRNCEPFLELSGLASLLGVVYSAHILDLLTQHPAANAKNAQQDANEAQKTLLSCAREAEAKLDFDALQQAFPRTWAARSKGALDSETLKPGAFGGRYKLPLGVQSSPVVAARAGTAMLREWSERQGLEYRPKLEL